MTIGIYALFWPSLDKVYIGQSVNIESRYTTHLWYLSTGSHSNYLVQNIYNKYGKPELHIVERSSSEELNYLEVVWTNEFDSLHSGLNIVSPGDSASGVTSKNSKYSKLLILKIFSLLYRTTLKYREIASRLSVPTHLVSDISSSRSHLWLNEEYEDKYAIMTSNRRLRIHCSKPQTQVRNRNHRPLVSPSGEIYTGIDNIMGFCKGHLDLSRNIKSSTSKISAVLKENRASYLGWHLQLPDARIG